MNYGKQLEDERWQVKRIKILQRDKFKCVKCGHTDNLHIHHLYYVYYKKAWQYPNSALVTLCFRCHKKWHDEHELEFRESIYSKKNKIYNAPFRKGNSKKRVGRIKKKTGTPKIVETKKEKQKRLAILKLKDEKNIKLKMINSSNIDNKEGLLNKVSSFTIPQLTRYLEFKK